MGVLGISLIAATVVLFCLRRPVWFSVFLRNIQQSRLGPPPQPPLIREPENEDPNDTGIHLPVRGESTAIRPAVVVSDTRASGATGSGWQSPKVNVDHLTMPPPPPRPPAVQLITEEEEKKETPLGERREATELDTEGQTTPKPPTLVLDDDSIPQFALSVPESKQPASSLPSRGTGGAPSQAPLAVPVHGRTNPPSGLMAPPPRPVPSTLLRPRQPGSSTLPFAAPSSGPVPNRSPFASSPSSSSSSLFPPPTLATKPKKPGREIALAPGHSPLDWARLSSDPRENLRGLPADTPYLRVTPSMLKKMTGRKKKDAWTVLGGRVYNITPYLPFHPGGEPELLRCAGRDGNKLFGEIHPWVNYENMLSACLIGIFVPEEEGPEAAAGSNSRRGPEFDMEAMD